MSAFLVKAHLLDDHRKVTRVIYCETTTELVEQIHLMFDLHSQDGYIIRYISQKYEQEIELNSSTTELYELQTKLSVVISSRPRWMKTNGRVNEEGKQEKRLRDFQLSDYFNKILFPPDPNSQTDSVQSLKKRPSTKKKGGKKKKEVKRRTLDYSNPFENPYEFADSEHLKYLISTKMDADIPLENIFTFITTPNPDGSTSNAHVKKKKDAKKKTTAICQSIEDKLYVIYFWIKEKLRVRRNGTQYETLEEVFKQREGYSHNLAKLFKFLAEPILDEHSPPTSLGEDESYQPPSSCSVIRGRFRYQDNNRIIVKSSYWNLVRIDGRFFMIDCSQAARNNCVTLNSREFSNLKIGFQDDDSDLSPDEITSLEQRLYFREFVQELQQSQQQEEEKEETGVEEEGNEEVTVEQLRNQMEEVLISHLLTKQNQLSSKSVTQEYFTRGHCGVVDDIFTFLVPPNLFIRDHLPDRPYYQVLPQPISTKGFEKSILRTNLTMKYGIKPLSTNQRVIRVYNTNTFELELNPLPGLVFTASVHQVGSTSANQNEPGTSKKSSPKSPKISLRELPNCCFFQKVYDIPVAVEELPEGGENKPGTAQTDASSSRKQLKKSGRVDAIVKDEGGVLPVPPSTAGTVNSVDEGGQNGTIPGSATISTVGSTSTINMSMLNSGKFKRGPRDVLFIRFPEFGKKYLVKVYFQDLRNNTQSKNIIDSNKKKKKKNVYNDLLGSQVEGSRKMEKNYEFGWFYVIQPSLKKRSQEGGSGGKGKKKNGGKDKGGPKKMSNATMMARNRRQSPVHNTKYFATNMGHEHEFCVIKRSLFELEGMLVSPRDYYLDPFSSLMRNTSAGSIQSTVSGAHFVDFHVEFGVGVKSVLVIDTMKERELMARKEERRRRKEEYGEEDDEEEEEEEEEEGEISEDDDDDGFLEDELKSEEERAEIRRRRRLKKLKEREENVPGEEDVVLRLEREAHVVLGGPEDPLMLDDVASLAGESGRDSLRSTKNTPKKGKSKSRKGSSKPLKKQVKSKKKLREVWRGTLNLRKVVGRELKLVVIKNIAVNPTTTTTTSSSSSERKGKRKGKGKGGTTSSTRKQEEKEVEAEEGKHNNNKKKEEVVRTTLAAYVVVSREKKKRKGGTTRPPSSTVSRRRN